MIEFSSTDLVFIGLIFILTGFVRTGLGFGGGVFGLPLMLLVGATPIYWLPIIGIHLLFFASLSLTTALKQVDWQYIKKSLTWILPAKILGVIGLLNLPDKLMIIFVFSLSFVYSAVWVLEKTIHSNNIWLDRLFLILGGYVSGSTLIGAPLIVAVFVNNVKKHQLRNTLFILWVLLVGIKMSAFMIVKVPIDWQFSLTLIPVAAVGHYLGLRAHKRLLSNDRFFKRMVGGALMAVSIIGFIKVF